MVKNERNSARGQKNEGHPMPGSIAMPPLLEKWYGYPVPPVQFQPVSTSI